jgi:hypothetical protein
MPERRDAADEVVVCRHGREPQPHVEESGPSAREPHQGSGCWLVETERGFDRDAVVLVAGPLLVRVTGQQRQGVRRKGTAGVSNQERLADLLASSAESHNPGTQDPLRLQRQALHGPNASGGDQLRSPCPSSRPAAGRPGALALVCCARPSTGTYRDGVTALVQGTAPTLPNMEREEWTIRHFSQSNPTGEGQGDVARLLRRVADTLDELGDVDVQDVVFHSGVTDSEDDLTMTVYFNQQPRRR